MCSTRAPCTLCCSARCGRGATPTRAPDRGLPAAHLHPAVWFLRVMNRAAAKHCRQQLADIGIRPVHRSSLVVCHPTFNQKEAAREGSDWKNEGRDDTATEMWHSARKQCGGGSSCWRCQAHATHLSSCSTWVIRSSTGRGPRNSKGQRCANGDSSMAGTLGIKRVFQAGHNLTQHICGHKACRTKAAAACMPGSVGGGSCDARRCQVSPR